MTAWDESADLVIVGSGGGGVVAAMAAKDLGLQPIVLEKQSILGGSTAMSGGVIWVPNNPVMRADGVPDSYEEAIAYFEAVVGDVGPASSFERRDMFLTAGPEWSRSCRGRACASSTAPATATTTRTPRAATRGPGDRACAFRRHVARGVARQAAARPGPEPRPGGDDQRGALALALQPQRRRVHHFGPGVAAHLRSPAAGPGAA